LERGRAGDLRHPLERSLAPPKRSQLGQHYTGRHDIERVVEPVVMVPLRPGWRACARRSRHAARGVGGGGIRRARATTDGRRSRHGCTHSSGVDPHPASSIRPAAAADFLYVALARLWTSKRKCSSRGRRNGLPLGYPLVSPKKVVGLEIDDYAPGTGAGRGLVGTCNGGRHGSRACRTRILEPLETIRLQTPCSTGANRGSERDGGGRAADFIIGNPPFPRRASPEGTRRRLPRRPVAVYDGRVARESDLVCYFFENGTDTDCQRRDEARGAARDKPIGAGPTGRRPGTDQGDGDIFAAGRRAVGAPEGDVRISIIDLTTVPKTSRTLDGLPVATINADLTTQTDVTTSARCPENAGVAFQGPVRWTIRDTPDLRTNLLAARSNPNGRPNSMLFDRG